MQGPSARQEQAAQAELQRRMQQYANFVQKRQVDLSFPAEVVSGNADKKPLRTKDDLIQHRLIESGVAFGDVQNVETIAEASLRFIDNLNKTGCFHTVGVSLEEGTKNGTDGNAGKGGESSATGKQEQKTLRVTLKERNWYKLYIGGGLKQDGLMQSFDERLLPKVQFETSGSLLNLTGYLDTTSLRYALDQTSSASLHFSHERPLYTLFEENGDMYNSICSLNTGTQIYLGLYSVLDTIDHEWTRSYKEYQRSLSARLSNTTASSPQSAEGGYHGIDWSVLFRDVIPRRRSMDPYELDASPEIVAESGPSVKHSVQYEFRTNGSLCDDRFNPTAGLDFRTSLELAGPPGDVGFIKGEGGLAGHMPLSDDGDGLSLHGSLQTGFLQALGFSGLCGPPSVSDRFFVGGPMQLRGFVPSGIGPRAKTGGPSTPGGDALGGDCFYVATLAASMPFPGGPILQANGVRVFAFSNVGTVASLSTPFQSILRSTRAAVGCGLSMSSSFGRVELTYAVPTRYGPRDARRSVQVGLGLSFG